MKIALEWMTVTTEHHRLILDEAEVSAELLDVLTDRESSRWQGELDLSDDTTPLADREGADTLRHTEISERTLTCIEVTPPEPAEVGYSTREGMRVAEYGVSSQAGLASFRGAGVHRG